jgi:hypothetical protein
MIQRLAVLKSLDPRFSQRPGPAASVYRVKDFRLAAKGNSRGSLSLAAVHGKVFHHLIILCKKQPAGLQRSGSFRERLTWRYRITILLVMTGLNLQGVDDAANGED